MDPSSSFTPTDPVLLSANPEWESPLPAGFVPLRLTLLPGNQKVECYRPDLVLGRHSEADIRLAVPEVSRRHCRLFFQDGHWKVQDLHSLNGVYVNNVGMQEATLYEGDYLSLGSMTFLVSCPAVDSASNPAETEMQMAVLRSIAAALPPTDQEQRKAS